MTICEICDLLLADDPGQDDGRPYRMGWLERDGGHLHVGIRHRVVVGGPQSLWPPPHDADAEARAFYVRAWDLANPEPEEELQPEVEAR